jgi:SpoVK/Ycf46/Vps4 family AAA+-type ATPase
LVREASVTALKEFIGGAKSSGKPVEVNKHHFDVAFSKVKPSVSEKVRWGQNYIDPCKAKEFEGKLVFRTDYI